MVHTQYTRDWRNDRDGQFGHRPPQGFLNSTKGVAAGPPEQAQYYRGPFGPTAPDQFAGAGTRGPPIPPSGSSRRSGSQGPPGGTGPRGPSPGPSGSKKGSQNITLHGFAGQGKKNAGPGRSGQQKKARAVHYVEVKNHYDDTERLKRRHIGAYQRNAAPPARFSGVSEPYLMVRESHELEDSSPEKKGRGKKDDEQPMQKRVRKRTLGLAEDPYGLSG